MATEAQTQVLVRFVTKLPPELHVPATEVAVPASVKRYGLSKIINHLLALDPPRPFDFIIGGELLRKSLEHHALDVGASAEAVLEVEYVPAVVPPRPQPSAEANDWVSAVASSDTAEGPCTSGSCDGTVRVWEAAAPLAPKAACLAHPGGVNALALVQPSGGALALSAGKDHRLVLWDLGGAAPAAVAAYTGHHDAVDAVAASPSGRRCASGGWDGALLVWRTGPEVVEAAALAGASGAGNAGSAAGAEGSTKRAPKKPRRGGGADGGAAAGNAAPPAPLVAPALKEEAIARLQGHTGGCVGALSWPEEPAVFSGGWDHSVRRHDVPTGINTDTYNGSNVVLAVAVAPMAPRVVAFGGSERCVRLWDTRAGGAGGAAAARSFLSHGGWVSSLAWRPGSEHVFVSACYDGNVLLWDARTSVPLATLPQHQDKALCVGWWGPDCLVSGGADCALRVAVMSGGAVQGAEPGLGAAAS